MRTRGRKGQVAVLCIALAWAAAAARGQQSPAAQTPQQPSPESQVRTGTSSGIELDTRLQNLLADHQFIELEKQLDRLPPEQQQLYRGILANRENNLDKSIEFLEPLVDKVTASGNTAQEKLVRKALAEDYLRKGDMEKAAKAYEALDTRLHSTLSSDERDEIELPLKLAPLAAKNPAMSVDTCEPFVMQVDRDPLGLLDIPVFVDALPRRWMLDPTAPFNLIARSTAREIGLKVSEETATINGLTGKPVQVRTTVIPRLTVGGRLTLRNVTAFVFEDEDYAFRRTGYRVQGVLAYPALRALGSLTIKDDSTVEVRPAGNVPANAVTSRSPRGARFFLDGDQLIVALGSSGDERMFVVDAAGQQSYFTSRYFDEHASEFEKRKAEPFTIPGSRYAAQPAYAAETLPLDVGGITVHVHFIEVLTQPVGDAALDDVYGVLGVDVLDQLRKYTFDYQNMRFIVPADDGPQ